MKTDPFLEQREEIIVLMDLYGKLLSPKQNKTLTSYFRYDLSLGEIAEEENVSRAAVHDALSKGVERLNEIESDLGFAKRERKLQRKAQAALSETDPSKRIEALENLGKEILHGI